LYAGSNPEPGFFNEVFIFFKGELCWRGRIYDAAYKCSGGTGDSLRSTLGFA